jgi:hypothetical protein
MMMARRLPQVVCCAQAASDSGRRANLASGRRASTALMVPLVLEFRGN